MDVKEFLQTSKLINRSEVARLMYPRNSKAENALLVKLAGRHGRHFSRKDALLAISVLNQLGVDLSTLTVADDY